MNTIQGIHCHQRKELLQKRYNGKNTSLSTQFTAGMGIEESKITAQHEIIPQFFLLAFPGWRPMFHIKKAETKLAYCRRAKGS